MRRNRVTIGCDHVIGCIQDSNIVTTEAVRQSYTTASTMYRTFVTIPTWIATRTGADGKRIDDKNIHSPSTTSSFGIQISTTIRFTEKGLLEREIVIYSLSTALLVLVILLCTACHQRYKKIYNSLRTYQTDKRRRNIPENPLPELPLETIEGIYEVIDESNMIDNIEQVSASNSSVTDNNGSYIQPNSNGYLTPYQPADDDVNTDNSNDNESDSQASLDTSVHASTTSNNKLHGTGSGYLIPHQPTVHSTDIHKYSPTQNIDDTGSSGSERLIEGSSYLNPYQPVIQTRDSHEYTYVIRCSNGSESSLSDICTKEIGVEFRHSYQDLKSEIDTHEYKTIDVVTCDTVSINEGIKDEDFVETLKILQEEDEIFM